MPYLTKHFESETFSCVHFFINLIVSFWQDLPTTLCLQPWYDDKSMSGLCLETLKPSLKLFCYVTIYLYLNDVVAGMD